MRNHTVILVLAALVAVLAAGCGGGGSSVPSDGVAVVGDQTITKAQFDQLLGQAKKSYSSQKRPFPKPGSPEYEQLKNQAMQYLVQRAEFAQKAKDLDVEVTGEVKISDADVKKYYDGHKTQYSVPEQREIAHILVKKKQLADDLYNQIKAGANFAALAKKYSQDPGSKNQGGKLTVSKGQTVAPFDQTAFLMHVGQISRPVKTEFGYHIIKALGPIKPAKSTPFSQVKESIRQQIGQQKKNEAMSTWVNDVKKEFAKKIHYQVGYAPASTSTAATTTG